MEGTEREWTAFATVGTTQFDALTRALVSPEVTSLLARQGYTRLLLQIGRGAEPPLAASAGPAPPLRVEWYRFKDSLEPDMHGAALLITHAGAGSIMEALKLFAPLLVVVNDALMDNHQEARARPPRPPPPARTEAQSPTFGGPTRAWLARPQELAYELDQRAHLVATTPAKLLKALESMPGRVPALRPWPGGDPSVFSRHLGRALGLE